VPVAAVPFLAGAWRSVIAAELQHLAARAGVHLRASEPGPVVAEGPAAGPLSLAPARQHAAQPYSRAISWHVK
jgi:hypothetical protein